MSRTQRTVTVGLWGLVVVSLLGLLAVTRWEGRADRARAADRASLAAGQVLELDAATGRLVPSTQKAVDYTFAAPAFRLVDQQGQPFDSSRLKGKVWTAMFFFSQCTGVCPSMTDKIETLQAATNDPRVNCVSFSVDPARDTPERLAKYAEKTHADPARWHFLTGEVADVKRVASGFRLPFDKPTDHSSKIMLVDQAGTVRNYYESQDDAEMRRLAVDVRRLLDEGPTPVASAKGVR